MNQITITISEDALTLALLGLDARADAMRAVGSPECKARAELYDKARDELQGAYCDVVAAHAHGLLSPRSLGA